MNIPYDIIEILLVESSLADVAHAKALLKQEKIVNVLHHESSAARVLAFVRDCEKIPDMMMIDTALPDKSAYALIEALKQQEKCRNCWFVVCADSAHPDDVEAMSRLDVDFYVQKPLSAPKLRRIVEYIDGLSSAIVREAN